MDKNNLFVGQKVYLLWVDKIIEVTITGIGKKYFKIDKRPYNYLIKENINKAHVAVDKRLYNSTFGKIFKTHKDLENFNINERKKNQLRVFFSRGFNINNPKLKFNILKLSKIYEIIDIIEDENNYENSI